MNNTNDVDYIENIKSIGKTSKAKTSKSNKSTKYIDANKSAPAKLIHNTVKFNNFVDYYEANDNISDNISTASESEFDDLSNSDSILEMDNISEPHDAHIKQSDTTDIYDSDEEEINDDYEDNLDELLCDEPLRDTIKYIYELFMEKHEQLDNYKNRFIVLKMCIIAVNSMPEQKTKPTFYLNFIESSINHLKNLSVDEIKQINLEDES
jgi:hypothetical protein